MSYRAGIGGTLAYALGGMPRDPHIVCDGCGVTRTVYASKQSYGPAKWLLDRKPAPGWELVRQADNRGWDYCPECKSAAQGRTGGGDMNTDHVVVKDNTLWCKACGQREPLRLPLSVKDFSHFCQTWAQAHANCEIAEQSKLVEELRKVANKLLDEKKALREAINALPFVPHTNGCLAFDTVTCCCGAATHNAALERVRRAAGLEDKP